MQLIFTARERFDPERSVGWDSYVEWSGLTQVREIVTLDDMLCPPLVGFADDRWDIVVSEDYLLDFFVELQPMLAILGDARANANILAVIRAPSEDVSGWSHQGFEFIGYDLMDLLVGNSALTNCGGFADVFQGSELNDVGLLTRYEKAIAVRDRLQLAHPKEFHANCDVWAVFRQK